MVSLQKNLSQQLLGLPQATVRSWQFEIWPVFFAQYVNNRNLDLKALKSVDKVLIHFTGDEVKVKKAKHLQDSWEGIFNYSPRHAQPFKSNTSHVLSCPQSSYKTPENSNPQLSFWVENTPVPSEH